MVMVLAAVVAGVVVVQLAGLLVLASLESRTAHNLLASTQALALAESGLEVALWRLNRGAPLGDLHATLGAGSHDIHVELEDATHARVTATGEVNGTTRHVSNRFERDETGVWRPLNHFREEEGP